MDLGVPSRGDSMGESPELSNQERVSGIAVVLRLEQKFWGWVDENKEWLRGQLMQDLGGPVKNTGLTLRAEWSLGKIKTPVGVVSGKAWAAVTRCTRGHELGPENREPAWQGSGRERAPRKDRTTKAGLPACTGHTLSSGRDSQTEGPCVAKLQ